MKKLDLLPNWVQEAKQNRMFKQRIAAVQVAIFLAIILTVLMINAIEERRHLRIYELTQKIQSANPAWEQAVTDLRNAHARAELLEYFMQNHAPHRFDPTWLTEMLDSAPTTATLERIRYSNNQFTITTKTTNIAIAETHKQNLVKTEAFQSVNIGQVTGLDDGYYSYELIIRIII